MKIFWEVNMRLGHVLPILSVPLIVTSIGLAQLRIALRTDPSHIMGFDGT